MVMEVCSTVIGFSSYPGVFVLIAVQYLEILFYGLSTDPHAPSCWKMPPDELL